MVLSLINAAVNGALIGIFYALIALGFTMVWASMRLVNVAHAALVVLSGYVAITISNTANVDVFLLLAIVAPTMFVFGMFLYRYVLSYAYQSDKFETVSIVATFGLAIVFENAMLLIFGPAQKGIPSAYAGRITMGSISIPTMRVIATVITLLVMVGLYMLLNETKTGRAVRAAWQDESLAVLHGINLDRTRTVMFGLSVSMAGIAGTLFPIMYSIQPAIHWRYIIIVFLIVVIGGIGNIVGTMIAGTLVGLITGVAPMFIPNKWVTVVLYLLLLGVLLYRPTGLFETAVEGVK